MRSRRFMVGLTLVELLVTLAVVAVLLGIAMPGFRAIVERNRADNAVGHMITAVNLARSEAVTRGGNVALEAVAPDGNGNEWGGGWRVRTDDGDADVADETVIQQYEAIEPSMTMNGPDGMTAITFNSRGLPSATMSVDLCDDEGHGIRVAMSLVGRVESSHMADGDCS